MTHQFCFFLFFTLLFFLGACFRPRFCTSFPRVWVLWAFRFSGPFSYWGAPGFPGLDDGCRTSLDFWGFGTFGGTPHLSDACVHGSGADNFLLFLVHSWSFTFGGEQGVRLGSFIPQPAEYGAEGSRFSLGLYRPSGATGILGLLFARQCGFERQLGHLWGVVR